MLVKMISFLGISCILLGGAILYFFFNKGRTRTNLEVAHHEEQKGKLDLVEDDTVGGGKDEKDDGLVLKQQTTKLLHNTQQTSPVSSTKTPKIDFSIFFISHNKYEGKEITFALKNSKVATLFPDLKFTIIKSFESIYGLYKDGENEEKKQELNESIYYIDCNGMNEHKNNEKELWNDTTELLKYLVENPQYSKIVFDNPIEGIIQRNELRRHFLYFLMRLSQGHEQEHDRKNKQLTLFLRSKKTNGDLFDLSGQPFFKVPSDLSWIQQLSQVPKKRSVPQEGSIV